MVKIKIKDNNRTREVAFIKTVPHTEKYNPQNEMFSHFGTKR